MKFSHNFLFNLLSALLALALILVLYNFFLFFNISNSIDRNLKGNILNANRDHAGLMLKELKQKIDFEFNKVESEINIISSYVDKINFSKGKEDFEPKKFAARFDSGISDKLPSSKEPYVIFTSNSEKSRKDYLEKIKESEIISLFLEKYYYHGANHHEKLVELIGSEDFPFFRGLGLKLKGIKKLTDNVKEYKTGNYWETLVPGLIKEIRNGEKSYFGRILYTPPYLSQYGGRYMTLFRMINDNNGSMTGAIFYSSRFNKIQRIMDRFYEKEIGFPYIYDDQGEVYFTTESAKKLLSLNAYAVKNKVFNRKRLYYDTKNNVLRENFDRKNKKDEYEINSKKFYFFKKTLSTRVFVDTLENKTLYLGVLIPEDQVNYSFIKIKGKLSDLADQYFVEQVLILVSFLSLCIFLHFAFSSTYRNQIKKIEEYSETGDTKILNKIYFQELLLLAKKLTLLSSSLKNLTSRKQKLESNFELIKVVLADYTSCHKTLSKNLLLFFQKEKLSAELKSNIIEKLDSVQITQDKDVLFDEKGNIVDQQISIPTNIRFSGFNEFNSDFHILFKKNFYPNFSNDGSTVNQTLPKIILRHPLAENQDRQPETLAFTLCKTKAAVASSLRVIDDVSTLFNLNLSYLIDLFSAAPNLLRNIIEFYSLIKEEDGVDKVLLELDRILSQTFPNSEVYIFQKERTLVDRFEIPRDEDLLQSVFEKLESSEEAEMVEIRDNYFVASIKLASEYKIVVREKIEFNQIQLEILKLLVNLVYIKFQRNNIILSDQQNYRTIYEIQNELKDISYISSSRQYVEVHFSNKKQSKIYRIPIYLVSKVFQELVQIRRSHLLNPTKIDKVVQENYQYFVIIGGEKFKIASNYLEQVRSELQYFFRLI